MNRNHISTGIAGLDKIMMGGFQPASSYLLVGGPGSGKTIISLQWLHAGIQQKAKALHITFAEPPAVIKRNARAFGWTLDKIVFEDFTHLSFPSIADLDEYHVFPPSEVEQQPLWQHLYEVIEKHAPDRVVIDSATHLRYLSTDDYQFRKHIQHLINWLGERNCVALLLFEPTELQQETSLALAVDGVIRLHKEISPGRVIGIRTVEIDKIRGSDFMSGLHPMRIDSSGVRIFPHIIEKLRPVTFEKKVMASGIDELDQLLMGGVYGSTCTLISGPSGTGKTTLATQFLVQAATRQVKSVLYSFEESLASVLERARGINMPLDKTVNNGMVSIRNINPLELYPDEFLQIVRDDLLENGRRLFVIDSLRGYSQAMEQFGNLVAHIQNLLNFVRENSGSIFLINEMEKLTGDLQITESGVSFLSDNVILIRYAEYNGEVIKVIGCLKKRLTNFQPALREFKITSSGLKVGATLKHLRGVLTGIPVAYAAAQKPELE